MKPREEGAALSDDELHRLLAAEKDAFERYMRLRMSFLHTSDVVECARLIWKEASAAVLQCQGKLGA